MTEIDFWHKSGVALIIISWISTVSGILSGIQISKMGYWSHGITFLLLSLSHGLQQMDKNYNNEDKEVMEALLTNLFVKGKSSCSFISHWSEQSVCAAPMH